METRIMFGIFSVVFFVLAGTGFYYQIPYSGWAVFIAVLFGLAAVG